MAATNFLKIWRAVYRHEALMLETMFPITYGGVWDYPYPEAQALVQSLT